MWAFPNEAQAQTARAPASGERDSDFAEEQAAAENEEEPAPRPRRRKRVFVEESQESQEYESDYDGESDNYAGRELPPEHAPKSTGPSQRTVGMALSITGLIVGLGGGATAIAGSAANDEPTMIAAAIIGLTGATLGVTGLIVTLTAPSGGVSAAPPTFVVGFGPTSAGMAVSF